MFIFPVNQKETIIIVNALPWFLYFVVTDEQMDESPRFAQRRFEEDK